MDEFLIQFMSNATQKDLTVCLFEVFAIAVLFLLFRVVGLRIGRAIPRKALFSGWAEDVERIFKGLITFQTVLSIVADSVWNVWLIHRGQDILDAKKNWFRPVWEQYHSTMIVACWAGGLTVAANIGFLRVLKKLFVVLTKRAQNIDRIKGNDAAVAASFDVLYLGVERGSWLFLLCYGLSKLPFVPEFIPALGYAALRVFAVYTVARLFWSSLDIIITTLDGLAKTAAERNEKLRYYEILKPLFPSLRRAFEATILVLGSTFAVAQLQAFGSLAGAGTIGLKIVGLFFAAQVLHTLLDFTLRELFINNKGALEADEKQRRLTILPLLSSLAEYVIFGFVIVMSLSQVGIDPLPVLAGAGVAGVAVGFGAQSLITDLVSGIFILWENYFIVGDYIAIGDREGIVEAISLRVTRLRDDNGRVHIVPNGKIDGIINYSKDYVAAEVSVGVSYEVDLDKVFAALEEVSDWVHQNVPEVLDRPEIEGVDEFAESALIVKLSTRVKPGMHLGAGRIIRKRIKEVFDRRCIEIAYPRQVIYFNSQGSEEFINLVGKTLGTNKSRRDA